MPRTATAPAARTRAALTAETAILFALVAVAMLDVFRLGFFGDDFLFLDAARRQPLGEVLLGQHGVWPWYRPLARELYFLAVVVAGPVGLTLARTLSVACLAALAWTVLRLGQSLVGPRAAAIACVLLVTYAVTKFLVAWASGFQDLLAATLTVGAVLAHARGRWKLAALLCGLAPLAKETGFLAAPLVAGYGVLVERRPLGRWLAPAAGATLLATALHVLARATWPPHPSGAGARSTGEEIVAAVRDVATGFLDPQPAREPLGWLAGIAAGALAFALVARTRARGGKREALAGAPVAFVLVALALAAVPFLASLGVRSGVPRAHFFAPAIPWACLALGRLLGRLPPLAAHGLPALLAAINVWGLSYRTLDMHSEEAWSVGSLGWCEAVRMDARTRRLAADLRRDLAAHPESLIVLYETIPIGTWIQTGDGPATREILRDPTVRAHFLREAPDRLPGDRLAIVTYDPKRYDGFALMGRECDVTLNKAANALIVDQPRMTKAWATYCLASGDSTRFARYLIAAADLLLAGPEGYVAGLRAAGMLDSAGLAATPPEWRVSVSRRIDPYYLPVLRRPRSKAAHVALADTLIAMKTDLIGGLELRIAAALGSPSAVEPYRLGLLLAQNGLEADARRAFEKAVAIGAPAEVLPLARAAAARLDQGAGKSVRSTPP